MRQVYQGHIIQELFAAAPGVVRFEVKELSPSALGLTCRKLRRIATEFDELADADAMLPRKDTISVRLAIACRPRALRATAALRRKKSPSGGYDSTARGVCRKLETDNGFAQCTNVRNWPFPDVPG